MTPNIKIFRFTSSSGEVSFYAGESLEDCKNEYIKITGTDEDWFTSDVADYELNEKDMNFYTVEDGNSFRKTLDLAQMNGAIFPCAFAFSEE